MVNQSTPEVSKLQQKRSMKTLKVRNILKGFVEKEVATTPTFKVTYISNKKPKIVKCLSTSSCSTDAE